MCDKPYGISSLGGCECANTSFKCECDSKLYGSSGDPGILQQAEKERQADKFGELLDELEQTTGGGLRYNAGKLQVHQVPTSLVNAVAQVFMYGSRKYDRNNWRKGMDWTIVYDCLQRHAMKWLDGEECDDESGLSHLYHMAANIAMLIEYAETCPELDDRYNGPVRTYETFKTHNGLNEHDLNEMEKEYLSGEQLDLFNKN